MKHLILFFSLMAISFCFVISTYAQKTATPPTGSGDSTKPRPKDVSPTEVEKAVNKVAETIKPQVTVDSEKLKVFNEQMKIADQSMEDGLIFKAATAYTKAWESNPIRADIGVKAADLWLNRLDTNNLDAVLILDSIVKKNVTTQDSQNAVAMMNSVALKIQEKLLAEYNYVNASIAENKIGDSANKLLQIIQVLEAYINRPGYVESENELDENIDKCLSKYTNLGEVDTCGTPFWYQFSKKWGQKNRFPLGTGHWSNGSYDIFNRSLIPEIKMKLVKVFAMQNKSSDAIQTFAQILKNGKLDISTEINWNSNLDILIFDPNFQLFVQDAMGNQKSQLLKDAINYDLAFQELKKEFDKNSKETPNSFFFDNPVTKTRDYQQYWITNFTGCAFQYNYKNLEGSKGKGSQLVDLSNVQIRYGYESEYLSVLYANGTYLLTLNYGYPLKRLGLICRNSGK